MIKRVIAIGVIMASVSAMAASNSGFGTISYYETRASGTHSVYLNTAIPTTEGCGINTRGAIVDSDTGAKTMSAMVFFALGNAKQIMIRVSGCTAVDPGNDATTVPRIIKVQLLN